MPIADAIFCSLFARSTRHTQKTCLAEKCAAGNFQSTEQTSHRIRKQKVRQNIREWRKNALNWHESKRSKKQKWWWYRICLLPNISAARNVSVRSPNMFIVPFTGRPEQSAKHRGNNILITDLHIFPPFGHRLTILTKCRGRRGRLSWEKREKTTNANHLYVKLYTHNVLWAYLHRPAKMVNRVYVACRLYQCRGRGNIIQFINVTKMCSLHGVAILCRLCLHWSMCVRSGLVNLSHNNNIGEPNMGGQRWEKKRSQMSEKSKSRIWAIVIAFAALDSFFIWKENQNNLAWNQLNLRFADVQEFVKGDTLPKHM